MVVVAAVAAAAAEHAVVFVLYGIVVVDVKAFVADNTAYVVARLHLVDDDTVDGELLVPPPNNMKNFHRGHMTENLDVFELKQTLNKAVVVLHRLKDGSDIHDLAPDPKHLQMSVMMHRIHRELAQNCCRLLMRRIARHTSPRQRSKDQCWGLEESMTADIHVLKPSEWLEDQALEQGPLLSQCQRQ